MKALLEMPIQKPGLEYPEEHDDEISLLDLFLVLWRYKILILAITICAMFGVVIVSAVSLMLPPEQSFYPNVYTPRANMLINDASSGGSGISAALNASGLAGLASMAGVNVRSGSTFSSLALYLVHSDTMLDSIVKEFDLIARYKIKEAVIANSRAVVKKSLMAKYEDSSGVFTISFSHYDPVFACDVVNYCVDYLSERFNALGLDKNLQQKENLERSIATAYEAIRSLEQEIQSLERSVTVPQNRPIPNITLETRRINMELGAQQEIYTQLKVQLELVNTAIASETPVFQVLEAATFPDLKSGPSRGMLCIIVTCGAFFISVFLTFVVNAIDNIRNDPEAMEKIRAANKKGHKELA
jgi:LPS O-antigen subunit length determinant protein (WzzB/FepE family)